jgi:hypothetical protein
MTATAPLEFVTTFSLGGTPYETPYETTVGGQLIARRGTYVRELFELIDDDLDDSWDMLSSAVWRHDPNIDIDERVWLASGIAVDRRTGRRVRTTGGLDRRSGS